MLDQEMIIIICLKNSENNRLIQANRVDINNKINKIKKNKVKVLNVKHNETMKY
jgi:hypothetical protein